MAARGVFRLSARSFVGPLEQRVLQVEISNSQDLFNITKILTGNIFGLILKHLGPLLQGQMRIGKLKSTYNLLNIGPRGLQCKTNL